MNWQEESSARCGELSLRQERMTLSMAESFRAEKFRISLSHNSTHVETRAQQQFRWKAKANELGHLAIRLTNLYRNFPPSALLVLKRYLVTPTPFYLSLYFDPSEHVLAEGTSTQTRVDAIERGSVKELSIAVCFTSRGSFDVKAVARLFDSHHSTIIGEARIVVDVRQD